MRLYPTKIPSIADEVIDSLVKTNDIAVHDAKEASLDVEAVLKEYVRLDREVTDKAKDILEERKLSYGQFGKIKRAIADERGFVMGEEGVNWMANQILEAFMQSQHIDEVFGDDDQLALTRKKIKDILLRNMQVDEELDEEVRNRIKNLQEGTAAWEVEYAKAMEQIKRKHGINE